MNELKFYKKAKKHFTKNPVGAVGTNHYSLALCSFLRDNFDRPGINPQYNDMKSRICSAVIENWNLAPITDWSVYHTAYFRTDDDRMKFIDSEILRLTKPNKFLMFIKQIREKLK